MPHKTTAAKRLNSEPVVRLTHLKRLEPFIIKKKGTALNVPFSKNLTLLDLNHARLFWFCFFSFWNGDHQLAILVFGRDLVAVYDVVG